MSLVDDRARVFGRFNLLDLAIAVVVLGLVPLAYGAYALFREPLPRLTSVTPIRRTHDREFRLVVNGEHLRPYMRVSLNDMQGRTFLFQSDKSAEVIFGDVPPGQYDVVLYDNVQERSRLPKAFTLEPAPLPPGQLEIAGFLTGLSTDAVAKVVPGLKYGTSATVVTVGTPASDIARVMTGEKMIELPVAQTMRLPVLLRVNCDVVSGSDGLGFCVSGTVLAPNVYMKLPIETGFTPFLIVELRPAVPRVEFEVRVLININDPALASVREGDIDVGYAQNEFAGGARVLEASPTQRTVRLRVPAYPTLNGWIYSGQYIRAGAPFTMITQRYQFTAVVQSEPPALPAGAK